MIICDIKIESYSPNSGKLLHTNEYTVIVHDEASASDLESALQELHGEWDELYIKQTPATCGDCKLCRYDYRKEDVNVNDLLPCPNCFAGVHTDSPACHYFERRALTR